MHSATANSSPQPTPYSLYTDPQKLLIISLAAYSAWFSTLTSFIYYPALSTLSHTFDVSISGINLTITSYMAVATIAPTLVGDTADVLGRRPVYMAILTVYVGANVVICLANSYEALLSLRIVQALAISGRWWLFSGVRLLEKLER